MQAPDLVQVVFDVLDDSWGTILDEVVHGTECFEDSAPLLRLALDLLPKMLHDNVIVLPVVGVVGEDLKLGVRDVPILVGSSFVEDFLVFCLRENPCLLFSTPNQ